MTSKSIIQLNEDAIFFLRDGDHQRTTSALLTAFTYLDSVAFPQQQQQPQCADNKSLPASSRQAQTQASIKAQGRTLPPIVSYPIPESPLEALGAAHAGNDLFTYYKRALSVPTCCDAAPGDDFLASYESHCRMSAILQFNLALSHHSTGVQKNSSKDLATALQLYEGAYFTIERVKDRLRMEDVFLLLLGIFFNMTHIHCNIYNIAECHHCMDWLKIALASRECVTLREDDYLFFSTNVSLLSIQMPRLAPAA